MRSAARLLAAISHIFPIVTIALSDTARAVGRVLASNTRVICALADLTAATLLCLAAGIPLCALTLAIETVVWAIYPTYTVNLASWICRCSFCPLVMRRMVSTACLDPCCLLV